MPIERGEDGDLHVRLPEHCKICGMLIRDSEIKNHEVYGGCLCIPGEKPFLIHKSCAGMGWVETDAM